MMRLRLSVTVALSLLTSAATAHAECAWVLWMQFKGHMVISGHATNQECLTALETYKQNAQREGLEIKGGPGGSVH
jgi:hypothetical protein